jgi:hypothetical protein
MREATPSTSTESKVSSNRWEREYKTRHEALEAAELTE